MPIFDPATYMPIFNKIQYGLDIATAISIIGASGVFLWDRRREARKDREDRRKEAIKDRENQDSILLAEREFKRKQYLNENTKLIIDELSKYQDRIWFAIQDVTNLHRINTPESRQEVNDILHNRFILLLQEFHYFLDNRAKRAFLLFSSEEIQNQLEQLKNETARYYNNYVEILKVEKKLHLPDDLSVMIGKNIDHFYEQLKADFNNQ